MLNNQDNNVRHDLGLPYSSSASTLGMSEEDAPSLAKEVLTHTHSSPIQDFLTTEAAPSEPKSSLHMTSLLKEDSVSDPHKIQADEDFPSGSQSLPKTEVIASFNFNPSFKVAEVLKPPEIIFDTSNLSFDATAEASVKAKLLTLVSELKTIMASLTYTIEPNASASAGASANGIFISTEDTSTANLTFNFGAKASVGVSQAITLNIDGVRVTVGKTTSIGLGKSLNGSLFLQDTNSDFNISAEGEFLAFLGTGVSLNATIDKEVTANHFSALINFIEKLTQHLISR